MKKSFTFRFSSDLIDKIRKIAHREKRSLTAQIEYILIKYLD